MAVTQTQDPETAPMPGAGSQAPADRVPAGQVPAGQVPAGQLPAGQLPVDRAPMVRAPEGRASAGRAPADRRPGVAASLRPLLIDIGIPVGTYYLLRDAFGVSLWLSLALSSAVPAVRAIADLVAERKLNLLAVLMVGVNLAGIAVSFLTGDPRAMIAKDSAVSSVIAFAILGSVVLRRPLMSAGLKPFMTRGQAERMAAWDRLAAASGRFRRLEQAFSTIWGLALLGECAARLVGAYTLPVTTMVWLGTVMTLGAIGAAIVAGGAAAGPIQKMIDAEAAAS